jgi:hypothetical protein
MSTALANLTAQGGWEAGGWAGVAYYFGDLNTSYNLSTPGPALGAAARYNFNDRLSFMFSANYGRVEADDANSKNAFERARNLSFRSPIIDGTAQFEFNFFPFIHGKKEFAFSPYLFAGLTAFYFNPQTLYQDEWVELRPLGTEGQFKGEEYFLVNPAIAYGAGIKIGLNYNWSLNIQISARKLFTDYLDDVSTVYADKKDIRQLRGELAATLSDRSLLIPGVNDDGNLSLPGRQRGNSMDNDAYVMIGIGIMYYFGDLRCPGYGAGSKH